MGNLTKFWLFILAIALVAVYCARNPGSNVAQFLDAFN